ncbi:hypothetical protein H0H92_011122 [Tricholoma furcatifolium]|nr:hypothetical protein H0H92_011122 [Tricholoma furcatifolium]
MHSTVGSASPRGTPSRRGKSPKLRQDSPSEASSSHLPTVFTKEPHTTLTSSLKILVEGTTPIESDSDKDTPKSAPQQPLGESHRAPRKSKTDALAALHSHARSSSQSGDDDDHPHNTDDYRIPVSPTLDLSTLRLPVREPKTKSGTRPFGLEDCPEYWPTEEEFKDPMAYIRSISAEAKQYGICKIIPPKDWKMPFVTETETFRFRTRLQRLNSIEASSRAKLNFLEQLYQFHKQQGNPRIVIPTINHKPLDLWLLRKEVHKLGGYEAVTREKKWSDLGRILGYRGIPGLSTQLKQSYARVILPYEDFCEKAKNTPGIGPPAHDPQLKTHQNTQSPGKLQTTPKKPSRLSSTTATADDSSAPSSPLTDTSSTLSDAPDEKDKGSRDTKPRSTRMGSQEQATPKKATSVIPPPIFYDTSKVDTIGTPEQSCEICHKKNRGTEMLLCDGCDCGFHMFCLRPPLTTIPKEQWFCYTCLAGTGGDFGFDEGEEHSLSTFQARDKEFRRRWWKGHPPERTEPLQPDDTKVHTIGGIQVHEYDVEKEFWRLVQSTSETVEVEYGADVHSTTHGSAMPTTETHPLNPYSRNPWNLNNIPIMKESLLRYIKSDISVHWGETKTWYGIPGDDAEKFEAAIKAEAPDLFEAQPDLLFQLVTLMNPKRVKDAGVRVYACNQRAGEFVVTFPKAYHAGFNQGFNFNEAVNFALPDWLSYGRDCVARYREHRKLPVFSHDELLVTITQQSHSIKTATWLCESLEEMTGREILARDKARTLGLPEVLEEEDRQDDQYQCTVCKTFCYLSFVMCSCTSNVACVDHADLLCEDNPRHQLTLRKRFSDEYLIETEDKCAERANAPSAWHAKLVRVLQESERPHIKHLRALLAEGERINYPLPELHSLRKCVTKANEWIDAANTFIVRKQSRKRSRRPRGRASVGDPADLLEDPGDRPDRSLEELYALSREVEKLGFDANEIASLISLAQSAEQMKERADKLLHSQSVDEGRETFIQECKRLLVDASSINVALEELAAVEAIVDREQLMGELQEKFKDEETPLTLEEVRRYLSRARACQVDPEHKHIRMLESRQRAGKTWEEKAQNVLMQPVKTIEELEDFADLDASVPMDHNLLSRLMAARAKAKDFDKQARAWLEPEPAALKPRVVEVLRMVNRAEKDFSIYTVIELKRIAEIAKDLETRCDHVLRYTFHNTEDDLFVTIEQWRTYAQKHLRMFALPIFDKLLAQIRLHEQWLVKIPWYCDDHKKPHYKTILEDVMESTDPDDDYPPADEFVTCICTKPVNPPSPGEKSDAVQCDHCFARFHGVCAKNGGSCPFCDHHHWNGEIRKDRNFHFCYLPKILEGAPDISKHYSNDWKQLEMIVHRVERVSGLIGQFLQFTSLPNNQHPDHLFLVRHYMRKLYRIQFAVSPDPGVSFGLDLAGLHRLLAGGKTDAPRPKKKKRARLIFGQDEDSNWSDGTRCICRGRTSFAVDHPTIKCEACSRLYHADCVFFPKDLIGRSQLMCPICCLRKNVPYKYSDVRVRPAVPPPNSVPGAYIDLKKMIETHSKDVLYMDLPPPLRETLFVDLVDYSSAGLPPTPRSTAMIPHQVNLLHQLPRSTPPQAGPSSRDYHLPQRSPPISRSRPESVYDSPRSPPIEIQLPRGHLFPFRRQSISGPPRPSQSPQSEYPIPPQQVFPSRKRKYPEDISSPEDLSRVSSGSSVPPASKRRPLTTSAPHSSPEASMRPVQTLSPSLAMIVSPVNQQVVTSSPRSQYVPPPLRNAPSGSSPVQHGSKPLMMQ